MGLTRGIDGALLAVLSGHFHPVTIAELVLPSDTIRAHSGFGTMTWDGHSWVGLDRLARFSIPSEGVGIATSSASLEIAMSLDALLTLNASAYRNSPLTMWSGATTSPGGTTLIGEPFIGFVGYVDRWSRSFVAGDAPTHFATGGLEPGPGARTSQPMVHSAESQQAAYASDTAGRHFVNAVKRATNPPLFPAP